MKITCYRFDSNKITKVAREVPLEDWVTALDWVDIYAESREEVSAFLQNLDFLKEGIDYLKNPEDHSLPKISKTLVIQNIVISSAAHPHVTDYITLIIIEGLIIRIAPTEHYLQIPDFQAKNLLSQFSDIRYYLTYQMINNLIAVDIQNMSRIKRRLQTLEDLLINEPDKLTPAEVITVRNEIGKLADIIEDQHVDLEVLLSLMVNKKKVEDKRILQENVKGYEPLLKSMTRLEERAESLRMQFILIKQEESTRKINVLTIVQAIFVPMTFLAGVYGMNFEHMPELGWKYGYLATWGVFILLAGLLLYFFKHRGWFD